MINSYDLLDYADGEKLYGWNISNLVIYDKPKDLNKFYRTQKCDSCEQLMRNIDFWGMNTVYFNKVFGTSFSREDMKLIYDRLGNGVNRELTVKFIESGYDMNLLKGE